MRRIKFKGASLHRVCERKVRCETAARIERWVGIVPTWFVSRVFLFGNSIMFTTLAKTRRRRMRFGSNVTETHIWGKASIGKRCIGRNRLTGKNRSTVFHADLIES